MSCGNVKQSGMCCKEVVKETFTPIEVQLQQYKKRDLKDSYEKRLTCIVLGKQKCVQRFVTYDATEKDQFFNEGLLDKDTIYPYYYSDAFLPKDKAVEKKVEETAQEEHAKWVENRQKLKKDMDKMDLRVSWLQQKPNKSALENRVMASLLTQNRKEQEKRRLRKKAQTQRANRCNGILEDSDDESEEKCLKKRFPKSKSNASMINKHDGSKSNNDKTTDQIEIGKQIRVPNDLISYGYLMSQVKAAYQKAGCEVGHKWRRGVTSSADMEPVDKLEGLANIYPKDEDVAAERTEMELSTGAAAIERKVDCWLTFEEYKEMINRSNRNIRPKMAPHHLFKNAHWPGRESNRRICYDRAQLPSINTTTGGRPSALFTHTTNATDSKRSNWGYDNEIKWWPTDGKYVKYGDITQRKSYHVGLR